jgi:hypothetical protein
MRISTLLILIVTLALVAASPVAFGHRPGTDGGGGKRSCGTLQNVSQFGPVGVGATKVRCRTARRVARRSVRNRRTRGWRCTGRGTRFGHCHRRGARRKIVHWYAAH